MNHTQLSPRWSAKRGRFLSTSARDNLIGAAIAAIGIAFIAALALTYGIVAHG